MILSTLFRNWWVILIQGILMIALSIVIFNNADAALAALAFWLGVIVIATGLIGVIAWVASPKEGRDIITLIGSFAICFIGILMISKILVTMKAITIVFGLLVAFVGLALITGSWSSRKQWSLWWLIALIGMAALVIGIKSAIDIYSGAESISTLIGIALLLAGVGMICLAFLKRKVVMAIKSKVTEVKG